MAPVAYGALTWIAGMVTISVFVGAVIGTLSWRLKYGLAWGIFGVIAYLASSPLWFDAAPLKAAALNAAPMLMTFLAACLMARALHAHNKRAVWATMAALGGGLVLGAVYMLLFSHMLLVNASGPTWIALAADVCLGIVAIRQRKAWQP
jgi:hypothetical protein